MGGYGSGRKASRKKVGDYWPLDINRLLRTGLLRDGSVGGWQWSIDGERQAWIQIYGETNSIRLVYRTQQPGREWRDLDYRVPIERVSCALGGKRPYFRCPAARDGSRCLRRVTKLHGGTIFACRHCHGLAYMSQSENEVDRLYRKADRLRRKIDPTGDNELLFRPKGMWQRTYARVAAAYYEAEADADACFVASSIQRFNLF